MRRSPKEEAERWWRQALHDYEDAQFCFQGKRYHLTCFLAQQSAEKALKAFLYSRGISEVRGHSVAELASLASKLERSLKEVRRQAAALDKYYIPTRYPNGLPGGIPAEAFDEVDGQRALELAKLVIDFIRERLRE